MANLSCIKVSLFIIDIESTLSDVKPHCPWCREYWPDSVSLHIVWVKTCVGRKDYETTPTSILSFQGRLVRTSIKRKTRFFTAFRMTRDTKLSSLRSQRRRRISLFLRAMPLMQSSPFRGKEAKYSFSPGGRRLVSRGNFFEIFFLLCHGAFPVGDTRTGMIEREQDVIFSR